MPFDYASAQADARHAEETVKTLVRNFQDAASKLAQWRSVGVVYAGHISTAPIVVYASRVPTPEQIGEAIDEWRHANAVLEAIEGQPMRKQFAGAGQPGTGDESHEQH